MAMKVRATTNFAGEICMATGDVRDVPESVAASLLDCGYLETVAPEPDAEAQRDPKKARRAKAKTEG